MADFFKILYQDDNLIAIDKPPGLLVHRSPIAKHETEFAVQLLRDQVGRYVYPVHRLDRPTSGVLLFTFSPELVSAIGAQWMQKQVRKEYTAIVRGFVTGAGLIDYELSFKRDKFADKGKHLNNAPQPACTEYHGLENFVIPHPVGRYESARYALIKLNPITGRKHQLRRHLAHIRHPIIGDTTHGDGKQNKFLREHFGFQQLALSCTRLTFLHPIANRSCSITCQPHADMIKLLADWQQFKQ
ncbi:pseudouridine synthase [Alteromonas ponticola]|uniref:tRNA pseudouridine synthase C n=1 Tax=Alteromonas aquimaris TaxID=2998417 RepID=A0ABT3P4W0_9ALTE|nr:pseudouridine synthase [Alteromonas aquimaris]MCW8107535.1 pseudouridine synthase [Alteromonas aquimaris]